MPDFLGSSVVVPGSQRVTGVLKYVGSIRGKTGMFGGIELLGPLASVRGKNSGEVDGVQYFDVSEPMTGLFMPWDRLRAANPSLPAADRLKSRPLSLKRASVCTPTPPRRSSPSPPPGVSAEAAELRAKLDAKSRESDRKEAILLELQATVDQLHPVLEDYERNLEEKDRKLKKQKNDYDRAREEWRLSLDLMLSSQQEAENLYEMQISDLKEEIQALASAKMVESLHKQEMADLQEEFKQSQAKNSQIEIELHALQEKLASFELKAAGPETDESNAKPYTSESTDALSLQASNGSLPIYKPAIELDPSQGRDDWCGLCERDGHDSLNCPYENDMF
ncbi:hypothetical protein METBIDRAFT_43750 [Metschnikowia bicuspidata var. bicuspidata NRRL YB-4993]|uniref:CAP-Gly domain-containing protein n=1 Tax=Metschnikowia bicuspidata var. bicuspidata NRRL YB-4993 TaxID=869754 RepID=A0A1A0H891_9ASCO|nr:hypothetical protein METBIDRAFT_43750 [Metschnikowia bicuspidata var. bicuspidata NRRL YB-4993]OBA20329.1 hypothetical protein METBIDRAFT_43750 [Metschnikowia bicuspidata var. bicuspidata NRRL YB-4993]